MSPAKQTMTSRPLTAKGGIRAQTKSRKVGKNWWAKRWMAVLEGYYMGAELPRGRAYAQAGQVLTVDIAHGIVKSTVQGSRKTPYVSSIQFKAAPKTQWKKLATTLSNQVYYAAKLLAGDMPESIEDVFEECGLSLFPKDLNDLETTCTCPGDVNPCKHIVAVYYLLAEEFDRDPFLFMKLRGLDRDQLIKSIGTSVKKKSKAQPELQDESLTDRPLFRTEAVSDDPQEYWQGNLVSEDLLGDVRIPPTAGALAKHLGHFPMWRGEERFLDALEMVYKRASQNGMDVFLGDW